MDISPTALVNPTLPLCPGSYPFIINVQNLGQATIDTLTVNWWVNGVAQAPFVATGIGLVTSTGTTISLGSFTIAANTPYDIMFVTSAPNNGVDEDMANDTLRLNNLQTGLSTGTYTINKNLATGGINFASFQDAVTALNTFGICGPVTFIVAPGSGPYKEKIRIQEVVGASATSTITFDGGPTQEQIWTDSVRTGGERAVIKLNGADWVTLKNLRISNYSPAASGYYGVGVHVRSQANNNTIENCYIEVDTALASTSANFCGIVCAGTAATSSNRACNYITIQNNTIVGGYYGITLRYQSSSEYGMGNRILNNTLRGQNYYGIYQYYQAGSEIVGNSTEHRRNGSTFGYGIYTGYTDSFLIAKNKIVDPKAYGLYFFRANWQGNGQISKYAQVENNMISGFFASTTTRRGIGVSSNTKKVNFHHNSVSIPFNNAHGFRTISSSNVDSLDIRNNSFALFGTGGVPVWLIDSTQVQNLNYNNYFSYDSAVIQIMMMLRTGSAT